MSTPYSDYPNHPLRHVPQPVLDAAVEGLLDGLTANREPSDGSYYLHEDDIESVAHAMLIFINDGYGGAHPPHGWHVFGSHANYREEFGEECPPLIFSEEVDEAGMPLYERIDPVAIRRGVAQQIAEETLDVLHGHAGCVSRAQDKLRAYLPTPIYGDD